MHEKNTKQWPFVTLKQRVFGSYTKFGKLE